MPVFNWLHLSDAHIGSADQKWIWKDVKHKFFEDLQKVTAHSGALDLVLFTGDIVFKGVEFREANVFFKELFSRLRDQKRAPLLLAVPGNHDLERPDRKCFPDALTALSRWQSCPQVKEKFWCQGASSYRKEIVKLFRGYDTWWRSQPAAKKVRLIRFGPLPGDFSFTLEKEGALLGIVGLNSAFLQFKDGNYRKRLAVARQQFHEGRPDDDGIAWVKKHHVCILMTHHPSDWLDRNAAVEFNEISSPRQFAIHLYGHMHKSLSDHRSIYGSRPKWRWQGDSFCGMEHYKDDLRREKSRSHGYSIGQISIDSRKTGTIRLWPRKAKKYASQTWCFDKDDKFEELQDSGGYCTRPVTIDLLRDFEGANKSGGGGVIMPSKLWLCDYRRRYIEEIKEKIARRESAIYYADTWGISGIGKSELLKYVYHQEDLGDVYKIMIDTIGFKFMYEESWESRSVFFDCLDRVFLKHLPHEVWSSKDLSPLLQEFSDSLNRSISLMEKELSSFAPDDVRKMVSAVAGIEPESGCLDDRSRETEIFLRKEERRIRQAFFDLWNAITRKKYIVIFLDHLWDEDENHNVDHNLGVWFLKKIFPGMENTTVILASRSIQGVVPEEFQRSVISGGGLRHFKKNDVEGYMRLKLSGKKYPEELVENVYKFTDGHPFLLGIVVKQLQNGDLTQAELRAKLDDAAIRDITDKIESIFKEIRNKNVRDALRFGCVARCFTKDLLEELIRTGKNDPKKREYPDIIPQLAQYPFFSKVEIPGSDHEFTVYRFSNFMREYFVKRLIEEQPEVYEKLNKTVSLCYQKNVQEAQEKEQRSRSAYREFYRLENFLWRHLVLEWLYHLSCLKDRHMARLQFARVYFDAFYWWGWYVDFPFCRHLIQDWKLTQVKDETDRDWVKYIQQFEDSYPKGYQRIRNDAGWDRVGEALEHVRQIGGFDEGMNLVTMQKESVILRGITGIFIAHMFLERTPADFKKAYYYYEEALKIFKGRDNYSKFYRYWILFELSELFLKEGKLLKAKEYAVESLRLVVSSSGANENRDHEVVANVFRVFADIQFERKKYKGALRDYILAVFSSYVFQGHPKNWDFYTQAFYDEMCDWMIKRIVSLPVTQAEIWVREMRAFWMPFEERLHLPPGSLDTDNLRDKQYLKKFIFPPNPRDLEGDEIGTDAEKYSAYSELARKVFKAKYKTQMDRVIRKL